MTDTQLYLAVGIPGLLALISIGLNLGFFLYMLNRLDKLTDNMNTRFDNINKTIAELLVNHEHRITVLESKK